MDNIANTTAHKTAKFFLILIFQSKGTCSRTALLKFTQKEVCLFHLTSVSAQYDQLDAAARCSGPKTVNEIQCAHASYIATQKSYTYNTKLHEQNKPET
jgi:hypothetical protein